MDEVLTIDEIKDRYADEWVLLENPVVDKYQRVTEGRVLCHSKDRDEVDRTALKLRPKHSAFLYTGTIAEGTEIVLGELLNSERSFPTERNELPQIPVA